MRDRDYYDGNSKWDAEQVQSLKKRGQPKICKQSWLVPRPWYIRLWRKVTFRKPERYEPTFEEITKALVGIERINKAD